MQEAVLCDQLAGPLFLKGKAECLLDWIDDETGLRCKGLVDWISDHHPGVLFDLKTTRDASPDGFGKSAWNFSYHTQDQFYRMGVEVMTGTAPVGFVFVAVEKPNKPEDTPLPPQLYELGNLFTESAERKIREWLNRVQGAQLTDQWPCYETGLKTLQHPSWARL